MTEKKDGAEMTCKSCGTELICHMSNYKGNYKNQLQWQNEDGKAHYSTNNGKDFTCNIPDQQEEETEPNEIELKDNIQTIIQESATIPDPQQQLNNLTNDEMLARCYDMLAEMYRDFTDRKIKELKTQ